MFKSVNELEQFAYDDCQIESMSFGENTIKFVLNGLIVKERNTQNSNYTKSYADTAEFTMKNAKITSVIIAGYSVYDADDNLLEKIDDKEVSPLEWGNLPQKLNGSYLYRLIGDKENDKFVYDLEIEEYTETGIPDLRADSYVVQIEFDESVVTWDRYLNRVES